MKRTYEKPSILAQRVGMVNKYQTNLDRCVAEIDGVSVEKLVAGHGSPLFVFSERALRDRIRELKRAFSVYYANTTFAWSYKTNYLDAICAILHDEGSPAEVVSAFEYEKARRLGVPGDRIIFNGPHKPPAILERAVAEGATINIDNFDEIYALEEIGARRNERIPVGMRINLDCGIAPQWSRFGFNLESGQAWSAAKRIKQSERLRLNGLHCHIGTFIIEPRAYATELAKLIDFAGHLKNELEFEIESIDLGGGFPSRSRLKGIYMPPDCMIPPIEDYARAIGETALALIPPDRMPRLILESGRAVVDEAGWLISSVVGAKRLLDGRKSYIIDAGVNVLFTSYWYDIGVKPGVSVSGPAENSVLYGPLCMNIDVVAESVNLPPLSVGAPLVLHPVGAYNVTQSIQFIEYRPAVVLLAESGAVETIREREKLEDVVGPERLPERLKLTEKTFA
jgi:diaminopimelate decarboxylase